MATGGFLNRLMNSISSNRNYSDPLFGGLIPRRELPNRRRDENIDVNVESSPMPIRQQQLPIRQNGMEMVRNNNINSIGHGLLDEGMRNSLPFQGRDSRIDYTGQQIDLEKSKLGLAGQKFAYDKEHDKDVLALQGREQGRKENDDRNRLNLDRDKVEIDHRKQALDEWKTRNPEGDIKTDENGRIVVIDKRTGESIDTGLVGEHFSEKEKLDLQAKHNVELEDKRQENRLELEKNKDKSKPISASQQRIAEDDAAAELLRDTKYAWLAENGIISITKDGLLVDNKKVEANDAQHKTKAHLAEFQKELKIRADERLNKTFNSSGNKLESTTSTDATGSKVVNMTTPDGRIIQVPEAEVEEAKSKGAKVSGEVKVNDINIGEPKVEQPKEPGISFLDKILQMSTKMGQTQMPLVQSGLGGGQDINRLMETIGDNDPERMRGKLQIAMAIAGMIGGSADSLKRDQLQIGGRPDQLQIGGSRGGLLPNPPRRLQLPPGQYNMGPVPPRQFNLGPSFIPK